MESSQTDRYLANRISQIEAHLLDEDLGHSIDSAIDQLEIPCYNDEIKMFLRLYLLHHSIRNEATTGMAAYNLKYGDISNIDKKTPGPVTKMPEKFQLIILAASTLVGSYLMKKQHTIDRKLHAIYPRGSRLSRLTVDNMVLIYRVISNLNFLVFLRTSKYLTLTQRLTGVGPTITDQGYYMNTLLNGVQMSFIYRERLWKTIAEFLAAVIPMINLEKIYNRLSNLTGFIVSPQTSETLSEKFRQEHNAKFCAICLKQPFNPFCIGCRHVFCYYCLHVKYMTDPEIGFTCRSCNYSTKEKSDVRPYIVVDVIKS